MASPSGSEARKRRFSMPNVAFVPPDELDRTESAPSKPCQEQTAAGESGGKMGKRMSRRPSLAAMQAASSIKSVVSEKRGSLPSPAAMQRRPSRVQILAAPGAGETSANASDSGASSSHSPDKQHRHSRHRLSVGELEPPMQAMSSTKSMSRALSARTDTSTTSSKAPVPSPVNTKRRPSLANAATAAMAAQGKQRRPSFANAVEAAMAKESLMAKEASKKSGDGRPGTAQRQRPGTRGSIHRLSDARLSNSRLIQLQDVGPDADRRDESFDELTDFLEAKQREDEEAVLEAEKAPQITPTTAMFAVAGFHRLLRRAQDELALQHLSVTPEERKLREANVVAKALGKMSLLAGCSRELAFQISKCAGRCRVERGQELDLSDGSPLYIVESGSLLVTLGRGHPPTYVAGPGSIINLCGLLSLNREAAPHEPGKRRVSETGYRASVAISEARTSEAVTDGEGMPYELGAEKGAEQIIPPPDLFKENSRKTGGTAAPPNGKSAGALQLTEDMRCFYNLCPHATMENMRVRRTGWLPLKVVGNTDGQGTLIAKIEFSTLEEQVNTQLSAVFAESGAPTSPNRHSLDAHGPAERSRQKFYQNLQRLKTTWHTILTRGASILPGVPPEVLWALAEVSATRSFQPGQRLVSEADPAPQGENILLLDEGTCIVEKLVGVSNVKTKQVTLGRLHAGAIIGDMCLLGAGIPRAASVRAETAVSVVLMPSKNLMTVLKRFPGMLANAEGHLKQVVAFLQLRLPPRNDVVIASSLFARSDPAFVNEVAPAGERQMLTCGPLLQEGIEERAAYAKDSALYIVEHGCITVDYEDEKGEQKQHVILPGACFGVGEPLIVGQAEVKMSSVRVVTPFALALTIPKRAIATAGTRHYGQERLLATSAPTPETRKLGIPIAGLPVFRSSTPAFMEELGKCIQTTSYMTGQTICVHGCQDASQTFVLKSGKVAVEKDGKRLVELQAGAVFGELMMLGAVRRRTATIRATTYCTLLELPRQGFMEAIDSFPEERQRFEELAMRFMTPGLTITWPIAEDMPTRLVLLLNMKATRMIVPAEDPSFQKESAKEAAVLILQGEAAVIDPTQPEESRQVKTLTAGECWNEQVLLGIPNPRGEYIVPLTACEVQVLSQEVYNKCVQEFTKEQAQIKRSVYKYMAQQAELRAGAPANGIELMRNSALFRGTESDFAQTMRKSLEPVVFPPGATMTREGEDGQTMYILVDGTAYADRELRRFHYGAGDVWGDAVMLGSLRSYQKTMIAESMCICFTITRRIFLEALNEHLSNTWFFEALADTHLVGRTLKELMHQALKVSIFEECDEDFLTALHKCVDSVYFAPGEEIIKRGEPCKMGETPFFILIAGEAQVEGAHGMLMEVIKPGAIIGEGGALGLSTNRGATVRVMPKRPAWCIIAHGTAVEAALHAHPDQTQVICELFAKRQEKNGVLFRRRKLWVDEVALPALRSSYLLADCDRVFLETLAAPLQETVFETGTPLVVVAEPADYMTVLIQGKASIEDNTGESVGTLTKGASFGEVNILGLYDAHIATVKASIQCVGIKVKVENLQYALEHWTEDEDAKHAMQVRFDTKIAQRLDQVAQRMPLAGLASTRALEEISARAVALQAERLNVQPGGLLKPLSDSDPCGPSLCIITKGKLTLEIDPDSDIFKMAGSSLAKDIMTLSAGDVFIEGTAAERMACARVGEGCEVYRVRLYDLTIAVASAPEADEWWVRFRMRASAFQRHMCDRLINTHAMISGFSPHPFDRAINDWKLQRHTSMQKANLTRRQRALCLQGEWSLLNKTGCWDQTETEQPMPPPTARRASPKEANQRPSTAPALRYLDAGHAAKESNDGSMTHRGSKPPSPLAAAAQAPSPLAAQQPTTLPAAQNLTRCQSAPTSRPTVPSAQAVLQRPKSAVGHPAALKNGKRIAKSSSAASRPSSGVSAVSSFPGLSVCDGKVWKVHHSGRRPVAQVVARPFSAVARGPRSRPNTMGQARLRRSGRHDDGRSSSSSST